MTTWIYDLYALVADADRASANADIGGFDMPLSVSGTLPATHWLAVLPFQITDRQEFDSRFRAGDYASLAFWRTDRETGTLQATNTTTALQSIGMTWYLADCLADAGLKRVIVPSPV